MTFRRNRGSIIKDYLEIPLTVSETENLLIQLDDHQSDNLWKYDMVDFETDITHVEVHQTIVDEYLTILHTNVQVNYAESSNGKGIANGPKSGEKFFFLKTDIDDNIVTNSKSKNQKNHFDPEFTQFYKNSEFHVNVEINMAVTNSEISSQTVHDEL